MDDAKKSERDLQANATTIERASERWIVVKRTFNAPARLVFAAWTTPDLFKRWWAPKSLGVPLLSCEMDVRTGGTYCLTFGQDAASAFAFHGRYIEVTPHTRIVWTNEESDDGAVTTVTFEEKDGRTHLTLTELYPSAEALEAERGAEDGLPEQFAQLDALLLTLGG
jgi:uncharacterized protein YndB with AHSA1/START domain